jgi:hypothetical protein
MADNVLNELYYKLGSKIGWCVAATGDVGDLLEQGETYTKRASTAVDIIGRAPELAGKLASAAEAIGKVRKGVGQVNNVCVTTGKLAELSEAILVLNAWNASRIGATREGVSAKQAARAFDKLFGVAGFFAAKLPPPVNAYAKVLDQIGISKFFENMQDIMDPESPNTPRGRMLHRIMTEDL